MDSMLKVVQSEILSTLWLVMMCLHDANISSSSQAARNFLLAVSARLPTHCRELNGVCRLPWLEPTPDRGTQASRGSSHSRRLSSKCNDLCQLSQTARVQLEGNYAREI